MGRTDRVWAGPDWVTEDQSGRGRSVAGKTWAGPFRSEEAAMKPVIVLVACSFLSTISADRGSCVGRCDKSFNPLQKCQCDNMCKFYTSCCEDYDTGDSYWRFSDGILERDFPRLIKDGFPGIPNNIDASLAVPACNIDGKERVYFFKGNSYWEYVFQNQPTQKECADSLISDVFLRYSDMDSSWEDVFIRLFADTSNVGASEPRLISENWHGIPGRVDSAMIGKLFFIRQFPSLGWHKPRKPKKQRKFLRWNRRRQQRRKQSSSMDMDLFSLIPSQSVYFFVK
ncbi:hypothetical protein chiPu_0019375, partial [Chiloscyllium punctatum]|nr:hypothetical protein [Chiloscyllium punctatum]